MWTSTTTLVLLGACFTCHVFSATHNGHNSHNEQDSMHFYFDPLSNYFVAATSGSCFMVSLTHVEQDHVHTTSGIEDIELTMMRDWMGKLTEVKIYHDDSHLPNNVRHWCSTKDIFLLQRNATEPSTPASPLGS